MTTTPRTEGAPAIAAAHEVELRQAAHDGRSRASATMPRISAAVAAVCSGTETAPRYRQARSATTQSTLPNPQMPTSAPVPASPRCRRPAAKARRAPRARRTSGSGARAGCAPAVLDDARPLAERRPVRVELAGERRAAQARVPSEARRSRASREGAVRCSSGSRSRRRRLRSIALVRTSSSVTMWIHDSPAAMAGEPLCRTMEGQAGGHCRKGDGSAPIANSGRAECVPPPPRRPLPLAASPGPTTDKKLPQPAPGRPSAREELRRVRERLHLDRVPAGVEEEHRRLLADLALEADVRRDDERDAGRAEPVGERARPPSRARGRSGAPGRGRRRRVGRGARHAGRPGGRRSGGPGGRSRPMAPSERPSGQPRRSP